MSYLKAYIHLVWSTKRRIPYLETREKRTLVWNHIKENAEKKNIPLMAVNGYEDHCHCLISLNRDTNIQNTIQLIKGESAFWINKQGLCKQKFQWQNEYYGASVSPRSLNKVCGYIFNQENHHGIQTFNDELIDFTNEHGFLLSPG